MLNFSRLFARRSSAALPVDNSLDAFGSENAPLAQQKAKASGAFPPQPAIAVVAATGLVVSLGAAGYFIATRSPATAAAPVVLAKVMIDSDPQGAEVLMGGVKQGTTPTDLSLAPGVHRIEVVHEGRSKSLAVTADAATTVVHHVEFAQTPAEPPAAAAKLERASTPTATAGILESSARRTTGGWLSVTSEISLQVFEQSEVVGTTASSRIMLPAGRHALRLVNTALGFSERREVSIREGKVETIRVSVPKAPVSVNAVPWAEVWIDGKKAGETPIGNFMVGIGEREVVFRHPELGERRQKVTIGLLAPARISVDMRKPLS